MADSPHGYFISTDDWPDFADLMRAWRRGELGRGPVAAEAHGLSVARMKVVVLHAPLNQAQPVMGELLRPQNEGEDIFDMEVVGWPTSPYISGQRLISVPINDRQEVFSFSAQDTADEMLERFQRSTIKHLVSAVSLGRHPDATPGATPMRWRIHLRGDRPVNKNTGERINPFPVQVANAAGYATAVNFWPEYWAGTGTVIPIYSALPTGDPPVLRHGTQCLVAKVMGRWCVVAGEVRRLTHLFPGWWVPE